MYLSPHLCLLVCLPTPALPAELSPGHENSCSQMVKFGFPEPSRWWTGWEGLASGSSPVFWTQTWNFGDQSNINLQSLAHTWLKRLDFGSIFTNCCFYSRKSYFLSSFLFFFLFFGFVFFFPFLVFLLQSHLPLGSQFLSDLKETERNVKKVKGFHIQGVRHVRVMKQCVFLLSCFQLSNTRASQYPVYCLVPPEWLTITEKSF